MLGVAFGIGLLLALAGGTATQGCVAPAKLVAQMLQRLEDSVPVSEQPNPSVLLAMNLAGATNSAAHKILLQQIQEDAVNRAQKDMTSGEVALYVLALLSSCQDPRHVQALGQTVNLLRILQEKTAEEMENLENNGVPKTTLYSVSLDALALCLEQVDGYQKASTVLAKELLSPESHLSVDTRAVAVLALACMHNRTNNHDMKHLLQDALRKVTNDFLDEQEMKNGMIGNIYSMGLALQALEATSKFYAPRKWDCAQAFSKVHGHDYRQPMAIAQVLPALVGRSYLEAAHVDCVSASMSPSLQMSPSSTSETSGASKALITVQYSITNKLQGRHFSYTTSVQVPDGSTLLKVMQVAEEDKPKIFSFQTKPTSWGPMVTSIHGLEANSEDRTYWQFLSDNNAIEEGVGYYQPRNGSHVEAVFSTY
ncbi:cobalamin binding intrinsic factor [Pelecanus crispus]|uniref:cobalamin binding intrinsic factor n=1 Tax=Pelecanus crispus TaxID=36300 RepID=UPI003F5D14BE